MTFWKSTLKRGASVRLFFPLSLSRNQCDQICMFLKKDQHVRNYVTKFWCFLRKCFLNMHCKKNFRLWQKQEFKKGIEIYRLIYSNLDGEISANLITLLAITCRLSVLTNLMQIPLLTEDKLRRSSDSYTNSVTGNGLETSKWSRNT
jgi:hypothetical protein